MSEIIINREITDLARENMGSYSFNINLFRAFPSVYDGLKPVSRRIIYSMHELGLTPRKERTKVANVVGNVLGNFHPHGDAAVADALVKMGQNFYMNLTLIDGKGNMGSQSGDLPAAMRYIECRMTQYCSTFLEDIEKNAVDWTPNYDNRLFEPITLPVKYPNLIINGSYGIGQAYISSIPSHNFKDVIELTKEIIKNPDNIDLDYIAKKLRPDYPTGGIIINNDELIEAYKTGVGTVKLRAKITHDKNNNLVVTEIPYLTTIGNILDKIQEVAKEEKIVGISDIIDSSNEKNGVSILIKIKKGYDSNIIENLLYKFTPLQSSLVFNLIAVDNVTNKFKIYNILELFQNWINYRRTTLKRIFNYSISKINNRLHIIEGLLIVLNDIDTAIEIIKNSKDKQESKENILKKYKLTEIQALAVIEMQLYKLSGLSRDELINEKAKLEKELKKLTKYFSDPKALDNYIINELDEGEKLFSKERKTKCTNIDDNNIEETIPDIDYTIFITKKGYIKKVNSNSIKSQNKGGMGRSIGKLKEGDYVTTSITANNRDNLFLFTNIGKIYKIKIYDIGDLNITSNGIIINSIIPVIRNDEFIVSALAVSNDKLNEYYDNENICLLFVTKNGIIKKSSFYLYKNISKSGIIALKLNKDDTVINTAFIDKDNYDIIIGTKLGMGIRYSLNDISITSRTTIGVKAMQLNDKDEIVSFEVIKNDTDKENLFLISSRGNGKKINYKGIKALKRTQKPFILTKLKRGEYLVKMVLVNDEDEITIIANTKLIKVESSKIETLLRASELKNIIKLTRDEKVLDCIL